MNGQGPDTDIVTGKPLAMVETGKELENKTREATLLKAKAEYFGLSASGEGKKLIALVQNHLNKRIDDLVKQDPEAKVLVKLLADIGMKENQAKKAAERLVNMNIKKE